VAELLNLIDILALEEFLKEADARLTIMNRIRRL